MPIGMPGWPDFAFSTASAERNRIALARRAVSTFGTGRMDALRLARPAAGQASREWERRRAAAGARIVPHRCRWRKANLGACDDGHYNAGFAPARAPPLDRMNAIPDRKHAREAGKLAKRLRHQVGRAIADFNMIEDGDRVMVCLSGGKDSWTLLDILLRLRAKAPVRFDLVAVHLDQKQPGYDPTVLPAALRAIGVPFEILEQDTYSVVRRVIPEGKTMCSLCSRLRRGSLYTYAAENGFNRIALGHHRDDIVETLFLNLFHQGTLKAMPPKLRSDD